jgi:hypothetical protein
MKQQPGYPDKQPTEKPPHRTDGYNSQAAPVTPPAAAKFGVGARSLEQIKEATERRREHSHKLSDPSRKGWPKQSPFS